MTHFNRNTKKNVSKKVSLFLHKVELEINQSVKSALHKTPFLKDSKQGNKNQFFTKLLVKTCIKLNVLKSAHIRNYFILKLYNKNDYKLLFSAIFFNFLENNYTIGDPKSSKVSSSYLNIKMSINDYFFSSHSTKKWNKNSRWYSMEEIISHFIFYSEGFSLPSGFSYGSVEAPKGHLGVSMVSQNSNKPSRARIKSSIQNMMGQVTQLVEGTSLGDFVVIVSGSYVVVGEVDR